MRRLPHSAPSKASMICACWPASSDWPYQLTYHPPWNCARPSSPPPSGASPIAWLRRAEPEQGVPALRLPIGHYETRAACAPVPGDAHREPWLAEVPAKNNPALGRSGAILSGAGVAPWLQPSLRSPLALLELASAPQGR